ncbi:MAG: tetratricopeptide repeat protein [Bacteroidia bacterium]|nr:tetratricopeptide repeat protein [Bacteroidia bacterium]
MRYHLFLILLVWFPCSVLFSQTHSNLRQIGVKQLQNAMYLEALNTLNDAIRYEPTASDLYFFRGYAKYGLDDYIGAEADYTTSIELFPYQPDVYINRAIVRSQQEKFVEAFEDFASAVDLDSKNATIYINRARINLFTKQFDNCINDCYRAIDLDDKDEMVYLLKGSAEMGLGNHYTAITSFQKVMEKNPKNPYGPIQMGAAWMELEQYDSAILYLDRSLKLDSNNIYALFNRALVRINNKDKEGAMKDLNLIITLSPYNSYAYFNRAIILSEMNEIGAAIRDLSTVIQLNPENLISHYYRGLLRMESNDLKGALEDFDRSIELFPDYTDGYMARSNVKAKLNDQKGAAVDHQLGLEAARRNQNRPDTLDFDEKNYLKNLIKLSGNFEEMNTMSSKFQNQYVDIQLSPLFNLFFGQAGYDQIELYDSYPKEHYFTSIISLANKPYLLSDSARREIVARQTILLDSVSRNPESYLIRAVSYTGLKEYVLATADCDSAINLDSDFVLLYFARANAMYGLYQQRLEEEKAKRLPGIGDIPEEEVDSVRLKEDAILIEAMLYNYKKVILLDPGFPFAYYNRGGLFATLGNYQEALFDFRRAVDLKKNFAEGYYNLGLIYLLMKDKNGGCKYLSKAGELGIPDAYKVMKRFCYE